MFDFKIFILTLENRQDRIDNMKQYYKKYLNNINFFYGLDKTTIKKYKNELTTNFCNNHCTIPMVGCASSHILLWKYIYQNYSIKDYVLILEDDTFINLEYLQSIFDVIKYLFEINNKHLFLQIVGEGFNLKKIEKINNLIFEEFSYHFFLGAYIISPFISNILYEHFYKYGINYHIDFSLNSVLPKYNIKSLIFNNPKIGEQMGHEDSNMKGSNSLSKCFISKYNKKLYYALNIPLFTYATFIITFNVLFLIILIILSIYTKNVFYFLIIAILIYETVNFDIC